MRNHRQKAHLDRHVQESIGKQLRANYEQSAMLPGRLEALLRILDVGERANAMRDELVSSAKRPIPMTR
jgi:hypothetical protein